jgi:nitroreductase
MQEGTVTATQQTITSQTIDTLNARVSIREYTDQPIDDDTLLTLLNAARRSPTSSNIQTYSFVVVRDPERKRVLAHLGGDQKHIEQAPVFVAICADLNRAARGMALHGQQLATNIETTLISVIDASIAGQSLALAAESLGLGTVMIGGMRNHPDQVADLLGLPEGVFVVYGLCIGYVAERPPQKPRLPAETVISYERYEPASDEALQTYDAQLAEHYRSIGRSTPDAAWTGFNARRLGTAPRPHMREFLKKQGFSLE